MNPTTAASLQRAYHLIRAGEKRQARAILLPILRADQEIADAWYLLGFAVTERDKRQVCFQEVLRLDPSNQSGRRQLARLMGTPVKKKRKRHPGLRQLALGISGLTGALALLLCFIFVGDWWLSNNRLNTVAAIAPLVTITSTVFPASSPTLSPTQTIGASPTETITPPVSLTPSASIPALLSSPQRAATRVPPTITPTETRAVPTPETRLSAKEWRNWPIVPTLSTKAQSILRTAAQNPSLNLNTFSRVGDCQLTTGTFLGGYVTGKYPVAAAFQPTVDYFHASFTTESITAANGLGINSVLNPMFAAGAGHKECSADETPLDCELRLRRPAIVMVAMGTNWKPRTEISFEKYLRQVVDRILQTGALPILATKADNIEEDWKLDEAVARVAYDYDLPLVNVWRNVQDLPNHGLEAPANIYLTGNGWLRRNEAWLRTLDKVRKAIQ